MKNQFKLEDQNDLGGTITPVLTALALLVAAVAPALADDHDGGQPAYEFITFDVPFAAPPSAVNGGTSCWGLNDNGEIVGNYGVADEYLADGVTHVIAGFLFDRDHFIAVNPPGSAQTTMWAVNDRGDSVGASQDVLGNVSLFVRSRNGTIEMLPPIGPGTYMDYEYVGINNHGTIVGSFLNHPTPYNGTSAGAMGFMYKDGVYTILPQYPNSIGTVPDGINDHGEIVGFWRDANKVRHGFVLHPDGSFTSFDPPGSTLTRATGINNEGDVVGYYADANSVDHGFLLSKGIFTILDYPGATDSAALGINNSGAIAGTYDGFTFGFVATQDRDRHDRK